MKRWATRHGVALLVGFLVAGGLGLFLASHEFKMERQRTAPGETARQDRYLALNRVLLMSGVSVRRLSIDDDWLELDAQSGLLIFDQSHLEASGQETEADRLLAWLDRGGRAVLFLDYPDDLGAATVSLLDQLQLKVKTPVLDAGNESGITAQSQPGNLGTAHGQNFQVDWDTNLEFQHDPALILMSEGQREGQSRWLQFRHGSGWLAITGAAWFWENEELGKFDHAALISVVMAGNPPVQSVSLLQDSRPAAPVVWPAAWWALIAPLLTFLVVLIWYQVPRLGPAIPAPAAQRRSLAERFAAEGWFQWQRTGRGEFQERLRQSWLKRHPDRPPPAHSPADVANPEAFRSFMNLSETRDGPGTPWSKNK